MVVVERGAWRALSTSPTCPVTRLGCRSVATLRGQPLRPDAFRSYAGLSAESQRTKSSITWTSTFAATYTEHGRELLRDPQTRTKRVYHHVSEAHLHRY